MGSRDQNFRFRGREYSLFEIEQLYAYGGILDDDVIGVSNDTESFTPYTLEKLVYLYGSTYPFRRERLIRREFRTEADFLSSSSSSSSEDEEISRKRKKSVCLNENLNEHFEYEVEDYEAESCCSSTPSLHSTSSSQGEIEGISGINTLNEKQNEADGIVQIDLPLFSSKYPTKGVGIGKQKSKKEIEMLRLIAPLPWKNTYMKHFKDLEKTKTSVIICRYCQCGPFHPKDAIEHLFSSKHIEKLENETITSADIEYWKKRFLMVKENPKTRNFKMIGEVKKFNAIPLIQSNNLIPKDWNVDVLKKLLLPLLSKINEWNADDTNNYFFDSFSLIGYSAKCEHCNVKIPKTPHATLEHILSDKHVAYLCNNGYDKVEYDFWKHHLTLLVKKLEQSGKKKKKPVETKKLVPLLNKFEGKHRFLDDYPRIPLLDKTTEKEGLLKDHEFDNQWNQFFVKDLRNTMHFEEKSSKMSCRLCFGESGYKITSINLLLFHLSTAGHKTALKEAGVTMKDFEDFTKQFSLNGGKKPKRDKYPIALMYSNKDFMFPKHEKILTAEQVKEMFVKLRQEAAKVDVYDFNIRFKQLITMHDRNYCLWCKGKGRKTFYAPYHLLAHILTEKHEEMVIMRSRLTMRDFEEWFDRFKILEEYQANKAVKKTNMESLKLHENIAIPELEKVCIQNNEPEPKIMDTRQADLLPLFGGRSLCGKEYCSELPTVQHLELLSHIEFCENQKICLLCDVVFSKTCSALEHIFSPQHLKKLYNRGIGFCDKDFEYWLTSEGYSFKGSPLSQTRFLTTECLIEGIEVSVKFGKIEKKGNPSRRFKTYSAHEQESLLLDCKTYDKKCVTLRNCKLTACVYCNVWLEKPSDVLRHLVSKNHIKTIRLHGIYLDKARIKPLIQEMRLYFFHMPLTTKCATNLNKKSIKELKIALEGIECYGPTIRQLNEICLHKEFDLDCNSYLEYCDVCKVKIEKSLRSLLTHLFSPKHLQLLSNAGKNILDTEFEFWMNVVSKKTKICYVRKLDTGERLSFTKHLATRPMEINPVHLSNLHYLIQNDWQISKFDEDLETRRLYGNSCCQFCNVWLTTPSNAVSHILGEDHKANMIKNRVVYADEDIDRLKELLKKFQITDSTAKLFLEWNFVVVEN